MSVSKFATLMQDLGVEFNHKDVEHSTYEVSFEKFNTLQNNKYFNDPQVALESISSFASEIPDHKGVQDPTACTRKYNNLEYCTVCPAGSNESGGMEFSCYINGTIEDTDKYINLLEVLANMNEADTITIYIDSPGGYIHSAVTICTHILLCPGKVTTVATGTCASAGSLIWSAGHICKVTPTAALMWHMSSHVDMGDSIAIQDEAYLQIQFVRNALLQASVEKGHLTKEEAEEICSGPMVTKWINASEMQKRLDNFGKEVEREVSVDNTLSPDDVQTDEGVEINE